MTDTAQALLAEMKDFSESWTGPGAAPVERVFGERLRALEPQALTVTLFRTYSDSLLSVWLDRLSFVWKDLSYRTWLEILEELSGDRRQIYSFLWFASESLGLDVHRLPVFHRNIEHELAGETFRDGGPHPRARPFRGGDADQIDYEQVRRRLAEEGAPLREVPPGEPNRHVLEL